MYAVLAHAGHSHGPNLAVIALLAVVLALGIAAVGTAVRKSRTDRKPERTPPKGSAP